jgi:hypothetical protein
VYRNDRLRFAIEKPRHWHFLSVRDFVQAANDREATMDDPSLFRDLRELSGNPILVMTKYPVSHTGFVPTVEVYANAASLEPFSTYEELCLAAASGLESHHQDYEVEEPTRFVDLCGFTAAEFRARFKQEGEGRLWVIRMQSVVVHARATEFCINLMGEPSGPEAATDDLQRIRKSIQLW